MLNWLKNLFQRDSQPAASSALQRLKRAYPAINNGAGEILNAMGPAFTNTSDGHIQTDIAAAACLAGSVLLRETVTDVERFPAGEAILSDVHQRQGELLGFMMSQAPGMGLSLGGWDGDVPQEHSPLLEIVPMITQLQRPLEQAMVRHRIPAEFRAHVGALAATKLVSAGHNLGMLDQKVGKALASYYLVAGSKTVPPALERS